MEQKHLPSQQQPEDDGPAVASPTKAPWHEPKLTFVEPKLTTHGALQKITAQQNGPGPFFGTFTP